GLLTKLHRVVLPGHGDDHLASSSPCWIPRVHNPGSRPVRVTGTYLPSSANGDTRFKVDRIEKIPVPENPYT
ncbi:MAG: hypothetical protein E7J58_09335, partial [Bacillota bacterium]|nr:hypothetical protein [Bacillota bacterium]